MNKSTNTPEAVHDQTGIAWSRQFYRTHTADEAYGPGWQDSLAKAEPVACPEWCTTSHGVPEDLFRNLVTEDDCAFHELTLAKTEIDFAVGLVREQYHSSSDKPNRTVLWVTVGGTTTGDFTAVQQLRDWAHFPGVTPGLTEVVDQALTRLADLGLEAEVDPAAR